MIRFYLDCESKCSWVHKDFVKQQIFTNKNACIDYAEMISKVYPDNLYVVRTKIIDR